MTDPGMVFAMDQVEAAMKDMARVAGVFREELQRAGFSKDQAKNVALRWLTRMIDSQTSSAGDA